MPEHGRARGRARGCGHVLWLAATLLWLLAPGPALAHKLNLFAAAEGRVIRGEVYFAGGGKAADVPVRVQSASGEPLAALRSGADGGFAYKATAAVDHQIIAETPDGHRASWLVRAAELGGAFPQGDDADAGASSSAAAPLQAADRPALAAAAAAATEIGAAEARLDPDLIAAIERAVARQVRPLREAAAAARDAAGFRDVLGGIGYIVGLAGLGLWWQCRRSGGGR
jgi:nickel transport protein